MVERGSCAEDVLFPEAIIDKLMGDEVMALYLPDVLLRIDHDQVPSLMVDHARGLLEAFVGNIGERALYDFTAVGEVVNTASWLQEQAAGGESVLSERVADDLPTPIGTRDEVTLKGKDKPQMAYRVKV